VATEDRQRAINWLNKCPVASTNSTSPTIPDDPKPTLYACDTAEVPPFYRGEVDAVEETDVPVLDGTPSSRS